MSPKHGEADPPRLVKARTDNGDLHRLLLKKRHAKRAPQYLLAKSLLDHVPELVHTTRGAMHICSSKNSTSELEVRVFFLLVRARSLFS